MPVDPNYYPSYLVDVTALVIAFVVGVAVPWVTELITHASAPAWIRGVLNFSLSTLVGVLTTLLLADYQTFSDYLFAIMVTWIATMRAHYAGMAKPIASWTAAFGIGEPRRTQPPDS